MCANCHVVTVDLEVKDLAAFQRVCARLGWTFHHGQRTYKWYGRWVDDSLLPEHLFSPQALATVKRMDAKQRQAFMTGFLGQCDHAVSIPGCTYELGLKRYGDHYKLLYDYWEPAMLNALGENGNTLLQPYAVEVQRSTAKALGYTCQETMTEQGVARLVFTSHED